ncbi:hypothetical protein O6H91_Y139200 [Diphasiastrum complanatum]|nr:hypothetical protein O6H91_Y139200 [Diphasiastrum complanatum]
MADASSSLAPAPPDVSHSDRLASVRMENPLHSSSAVDISSGNANDENQDVAASKQLDSVVKDDDDDESMKLDGSLAAENPLNLSSVVDICSVDANYEKEDVADSKQLDPVKEDDDESSLVAENPFNLSSVADISSGNANDEKQKIAVLNQLDLVKEVVNDDESMKSDGSSLGAIKLDKPMSKLIPEGSDAGPRVSNSVLNRQCSLSKLSAEAPAFVPKGFMSFSQSPGAVSSPRNNNPSLRPATVMLQSSHPGAVQMAHPPLLQQLETYSLLQQPETYPVKSRYGSDASVLMPGPRSSSSMLGAASPLFSTGGSPASQLSGTTSASKFLQPTGSASAEQSNSGFVPEHVDETELFSSQEENFSQEMVTVSASGSKSALSEELKIKIIRQVEFYFSDNNLPTDNYLMKFVKKDTEGFVPIPVVASFRKMKSLAKNHAIVAEALRASSLLVVSEDGKKVRRAQPLPDVDLEEVQSRTVVAENLPEDHSIQQMEQLFGTVGNVKMVRVCQPVSANGANQTATKFSKTDLLVSNKLHALVEYESVEEAERAVSIQVAELTDERNWRSGLRVRLLLRRTFQGKHGYQYLAKGRKLGSEAAEGNEREEDGATCDGALEKSGDEFGQQTESLEEHMGDAGSYERDGGGRRGRGRNRGRSRGRGQHINNNGRGHLSGTSPQSSSPLISDFVGKPPPGPRMPDGTRGFTMGRGKLLSTEIP